MDSKNLSEDTIAFLTTTYKSIANDEAKALFIQKAEKNLNVKPGQLLNRIELELVWEDFRSNGVDSEYDPASKSAEPQKPIGEVIKVAGNVAGPSSKNSSPKSSSSEGSSPKNSSPKSSSSEGSSPKVPSPKGSSNTMSKLMQLLRDGEKLDVLLGLLKKPEVFYCKYCKSLGLPKSMYLSHNMNSRNGNIICPRWNSYRYAFYINSARGNTTEDPAQAEKLQE